MASPNAGDLNDQVRQYWEREPCGSGSRITGNRQPLSPEWFEQIDAHRYCVEPHIPAFVQFERYSGARVLEIGVGAGTDHLQWARSGAECYGLDLTDAAIATTRAHLKMHGFSSRLQRLDAEKGLPFEDNSFDIVYSWGVIHHSSDPKQVILQIWRVLKLGGEFIGMMYGRLSAVALKLWVRHALLQGKPWLSLSNVVWHHMESVGTKAYTINEVRNLFARFDRVEVEAVVTAYDRKWLPRWSHHLIPASAGWNLAIRARK